MIHGYTKAIVVMALAAGIAASGYAATGPSNTTEASPSPPTPGADEQPRYTSSGELIPPSGYRDWVFLSSGYGMTYNPDAGNHKMFTNVFVPRWAYGSFMKSGHWPDRTIFVLEVRGAEGKGSIVVGGQFQGGRRWASMSK